MLPIYGALHLIPTVLFKRALFMRDPGKMLIKAGSGTLRSSAFLGVFVVIYQSAHFFFVSLRVIYIMTTADVLPLRTAAFCVKHNLYEFLTGLPPSSRFRLPQHIVDILVSKGSFWFAGLLSGLALFVEEKRRRGELAMYVLPKGLESLWVMARGKGLVFRTGNWGEMLVG